MSSTARAAPSAARRAQYRPRAEREDGRKKGKGQRNNTSSQNVSEASTSQSQASRAIQGRSTNTRRNQPAPTHCMADSYYSIPEDTDLLSFVTPSCELV